MLDLNRVRRDLESPAYGALSHVVEVLMRALRVDLAVACCRDAERRLERTYVGSRRSLDSQTYNTLRQWPTDPRSVAWHGHVDDLHDHARLILPGRPEHADELREASAACSFPIPDDGPRVLRLNLPGTPECRMVFVRSPGSPTFDEQDPSRALRFTSQASSLLHDGWLRDLRREGNETPLLGLTDHAAVPNYNNLDQLSATEHRVLRYLRAHATERQVAQALGRSPNTIHVHVKSIYRKLGVHSRKQMLKLLDQLLGPLADTADAVPQPTAKSA